MKLRMAKLTTQLRKLWRDELGQDLTEYALLVVLIALASVIAIGALAGAISNSFTSAAQNLSTT
jgi:Flp pilus assembly pilin Flp